MGVLDNLGINLGYLIIQALGFVIIFLVVRGYAYEPILRVLDERKQRIAKGLEDSRQAAIARENADAEAKKILDEARSEAARLRSEAAVQAEDTARGIIAKANEDARAIVVAAQADAEEERNRVLAELRGQVIAISMAAANQLVGDALDDRRQRSLIAEFFAKAPAGIRDMAGEKAEVTSALPLTDAEQANLRKSLKASSVEFKIDPRILGGLIVRVGDQVVDDSVAGRMGALGSALR